MRWSGGRGRSSAHARASGHPVLWLWVPAFAGTSGLEARDHAFAFLLRDKEEIGDVFARRQQHVVLIARRVKFGDGLQATFREKDAVRRRVVAFRKPGDH